MIKKRLAIKKIEDITIARSAFADSNEVLDLISTIKTEAGLYMDNYLEAEIDKAGLMALSQRLSGGGDKKV